MRPGLPTWLRSMARLEEGEEEEKQQEEAEEGAEEETPSLRLHEKRLREMSA